MGIPWGRQEPRSPPKFSSRRPPGPSPKAVVRKVVPGRARAQKACQGQWPPGDLASPPTRSRFPSTRSPTPPTSTHLLSPFPPTHVTHFPVHDANSELCVPPLQNMDSRLFSEDRAILLLIVPYFPVLSPSAFPARRLATQGTVAFILQTEKPISETLSRLLQDLPGRGFEILPSNCNFPHFLTWVVCGMSFCRSKPGSAPPRTSRVSRDLEESCQDGNNRPPLAQILPSWVLVILEPGVSRAFAAPDPHPWLACPAWCLVVIE